MGHHLGSVRNSCGPQGSRDFPVRPLSDADDVMMRSGPPMDKDQLKILRASAVSLELDLDAIIFRRRDVDGIRAGVRVTDDVEHLFTR